MIESVYDDCCGTGGAGFLKRPSPTDLTTGSKEIKFPKRIC